MNILEWSAQMDPAVLYARQSASQAPSPSVDFLSQERHLQAWEQAMESPKWVQYQESDIADLLMQGGQFFSESGNSYGPSQGYRDGAKRVMESYESFSRTHAGKEMISRMGLPKWDGYAMLDMEGGALAATISYTDGRKVLAWNSKYMDRVDAGLLAGPHLEGAVMQAIDRYGHPLMDPTVRAVAEFYEGAFHEGRHNTHGHKVFSRSRESEEYATYMETAQFYRSLAEKVKDSSYAMSKFYEAIAERSEYKAQQFGKGGEDAQIDSLDDSLDGRIDQGDRDSSHEGNASRGCSHGTPHSGWMGESGGGSSASGSNQGSGAGSGNGSGDGDGGSGGGASAGGAN